MPSPVARAHLKRYGREPLLPTPQRCDVGHVGQATETAMAFVEMATNEPLQEVPAWHAVSSCRRSADLVARRGLIDMPKHSHRPECIDEWPELEGELPQRIVEQLARFERASATHALGRRGRKG